MPEQISDSGLDDEYQEEIPETDNFADLGGSTMEEASLKSECRVCYDNECAILCHKEVGTVDEGLLAEWHCTRCGEEVCNASCDSVR